MTLLRIHVRPDAVAAVVVAPGSGPVGGGTAPLPGATVEAAELWRAVLSAAATAVADLAEPPVGLALSCPADSLAVWDEETLGAPRPVALETDVVAALSLLHDEPHTWAHLVAGRYVVGSAASYVAARLTRGVQHVAAQGWPSGELPDDLPAHCLPMTAAGAVGATDPATFLDLTLPLTLVSTPQLPTG